MDTLRAEKAIGAIAIAVLMAAAIAGVSPRDWLFWYSIPAAMVVAGMLLAKRAYACSVKGKGGTALFLASVAALIILTGSWIAMEHYKATPLDMGGHPL